MNKSIFTFFIIVFAWTISSACASESSNRKFSEYYTPDKFKLQMNLNVDEKDDYDGHSTIDQIRMGLDWNL